MTSKQESILWTCNQDDEYLRHDDINDAIEEHLDDMGELPIEIIAYGFIRREVDSKMLLRVILEQAGEWLDEEYSGEDGHDINEEIENAAQDFVDTYVKNFTVWRCEENEKKVINVKQWVADTRPDWLSQVKFKEVADV